MHALRASLAMVGALAAFTLAACSEARNSTGMISQRIGEAARAEGATEVDIGKLTTFGWAYFIASKPGATREEICALIRAGRNVCGRIIRIERAPQDHVFLLFGLDGQLTHVELHDVANGRFEFDFGEQGISRADSVFRIRRSVDSQGRDSIGLEPKAPIQQPPSKA
jgi:hypothetical protein